MINLSIQDNIDGLGKVNELREAIGQTYSDNYSSTNRSQLVAVSECGNITYSKEVPSEYNNRVPQPGIKENPSWLTWNSMFY